MTEEQKKIQKRKLERVTDAEWERTGGRRSELGRTGTNREAAIHTSTGSATWRGNGRNREGRDDVTANRTRRKTAYQNRFD